MSGMVTDPWCSLRNWKRVCQGVSNFVELSFKFWAKNQNRSITLYTDKNPIPHPTLTLTLSLTSIEYHNSTVFSQHLWSSGIKFEASRHCHHPSVTRVDQSKTAQARIIKSSPSAAERF